MSNLYFKCTVEFFVRLDEETAEKIDGDVLLLVSGHVANSCNVMVTQLNDASKETSEYESGEIETKYISARQGNAKFRKVGLNV